MKLITDNKVYVETKDLNFIGNLPNFVIDELKLNNKTGFEVFKNKESIDYFINRDEIINYNVVKALEEEGIYDLIHSLYEESFRLELKTYKSKENILTIKKYEYMVKSLKEYIDYRKIMDKKFDRVRKGELKWQIKKKVLKND